MTSTAPSSSPAILIARFHVRPGAEGDFAAWQAKALTRAAGFEGFANSELTPATASDSAWTVSLRFCTAANLEEWRNSADWHGLIGEAQLFLAPETAVEIEAKEGGAVCLKTTLAYERTLDFGNVPQERAEKVFGRARNRLTPEERKDFEDFIMWRLVELSASMSCLFKFTPARRAFKDRIRCCWWT